jgi:hypothetical protein
VRKHQFSDEDKYRIRYNCLVASRLDDRMIMVGIRAIEATRIHSNRRETRYQKLREAKAKLLPKTFKIEFPEGWTPPKPLPEGIQISLWNPPELPPNALELFT